jgi:O-succinylbenzoic acid--CoA ligase
MTPPEGARARLTDTPLGWLVGPEADPVPLAWARVLAEADARRRMLRAHALPGAVVTPAADLDASSALAWMLACWQDDLWVPLAAGLPEPARQARLAVLGGLRDEDLEAAPALEVTADGVAKHPGGVRRASVRGPGWGVFTSGTTGAPRCALLDRAAVLASARAVTGVLGVAPEDRWMVCMPLAHVGGLSLAVRALVSGCRLLVWTGRWHAAGVVAAMHRLGATRVSWVPTMLADVVDLGLVPPPTLQTVMLGGGPATPALLQQAVALGWPVHFSYGLTEMASTVTLAAGPPAPPCWQAVGGPVPGAGVRVVDAGTDGVGRIQVQGPMGFRGYATAEGAPLPATLPPWHDTGDLGRFTPQGLAVVDRRVDLIVSGGVNVYPAQVEAVLGLVPGVQEVAVVGLPDRRWGQRVVAVVAHAGAGETPAPLEAGSPLARALEARSRSALAPAERPRAWVAVRALPRTALGKVQRQQVRAWLEGVVEAE